MSFGVNLGLKGNIGLGIFVKEVTLVLNGFSDFV